MVSLKVKGVNADYQIKAKWHITVLVVNYGISNTNVLEIP